MAGKPICGSFQVKRGKPASIKIQLSIGYLLIESLLLRFNFISVIIKNYIPMSLPTDNTMTILSYGSRRHRKRKLPERLLGGEGKLPSVLCPPAHKHHGHLRLPATLPRTTCLLQKAF